MTEWDYGFTEYLQIGDKAFPDKGLFSRVAAHQVVFFRKRKEAQESLKPGSLRLLPPEEQKGL